jgi:hypothetical protein
MRQHHPPDSVFLLCLQCDRGEWRKIFDSSKLSIESPKGARGENPDSQPCTKNSQLPAPPCRHCGGATERRYPLTLALREEDRGLLKTIADWTRAKADQSAERAIIREFRRVATERAGKGGKLPPWIVEWLTKNPE